MIGSMRATRALIHLDNFRNNIELIRSHAGGTPKICLTVKANAYGHGIVAISRAASAMGVEYLAVATVDEAAELRNAGIAGPILLYSLPTPEEIPDIIANNAIPVVSDCELADLLDAEAHRHQQVLTVHMKIDTGMGRIGCTPEFAPDFAADLAGRKNLQLGGTSTHFAGSDAEEPAFTAKQIRIFDAAITEIRARGIDPGIVHASNSAGILFFPEAHYDMIRPGIAAYGYEPSDERKSGMGLMPVMDMRSRVVMIKQVKAGTPISYGSTWHAPRRTHIGTIPAGYGDGYNRLLSNRGQVGIRGQSYPIVGTVCMDHIMVDLGPECAVERYDDVALFGPDPSGPDAAEIAKICGTIPYDITCAVAKRVPRIQVD